MPDNYDTFSDRIKSLLLRWDKEHAKLKRINLSSNPAEVCLKGLHSEINDGYTGMLEASLAISKGTDKSNK